MADTLLGAAGLVAAVLGLLIAWFSRTDEHLREIRDELHDGLLALESINNALERIAVAVERRPRL